jgi:cysteine desulfurase family protein
MSYLGYFDNAATTFPKPEEVYSFMDKFYRNNGVNVGRGQHKLSLLANELVEETRKDLLTLFSCPDKKVVFTPSATEALNVILKGLDLSKGMNIYCSPFEHNAVTRVLNNLEKEIEINVLVIPFDVEKMNYNLETIKNQFIKNKPDVVILNHASNVTGLIAPIFDIFELSKAYNSINIVDMCQTAGLLKTDLSSENVDYAVFAGHKTLYGPFGVAGIILKKDTNLNPLLYGGTGIDSANQELPNSIPEKFEVGSLNIHAISGLNAALKWININTIENIFEKEEENKKELISILENYSNITIIGKAMNSIGVVSCIFKGFSPDNIGKILNEQGISVRTGLHCSPSAHSTIGTFPAGTVRFSVSFFNTKEDFDLLRRALDYIQENI